MLKLKQEFSELFEFFNVGEQPTMKNFEAMLEKAFKFSQKLQDKLLNGTEEEKKELQEFMQEMQKKVEAEKEKLFEKIGITENDIKDFLSSKENFSDAEWNAIQEVKKTTQKEDSTEKEKASKINKFKSKTKWIQS